MVQAREVCSAKARRRLVPVLRQGVRAGTSKSDDSAGNIPVSCRRWAETFPCAVPGVLPSRGEVVIVM